MKKLIRDGIAAGRTVRELINWVGPLILSETNSRAKLIGVLLGQIAVILTWAGSVWLNREER